MAIKAGDRVVHVDGSWPKPETVKSVSVHVNPRSGTTEEVAFFEGGGFWRTQFLGLVCGECDGTRLVIGAFGESQIACPACTDPDALTGCADDQDFTAADVEVIKASLCEVTEWGYLIPLRCIAGREPDTHKHLWINLSRLNKPVVGVSRCKCGAVYGGE